MTVAPSVKRAAFFNVGDPITFGKYQNKPGRIVRFLDDGKGNPLIEVEPIPKGLKKNKVMPLFRIRHRLAPKVATRYLNLIAVREAMTRAAADDMNTILLKIRKGVTKPLENLNKLKQILDHLGGWTIEPCVGLRQVGYGSKPVVQFAGKLEEAQAVHEIAKRLEVSSLPRAPQPDHSYTRAVTDVEPFYAGFQVNFELWVGAVGLRITAPNGKTLDALPRGTTWRSQRRENVSDLRTPLPALGKKLVPKTIDKMEIVDWLKNETDFKQQVLDALGMEEHQKAQPRTQENTGSCPACFRNIKLKHTTGQAHPTMVNHGYTRPGWGSQVGNCFGVGYPPFELSPLGTEHLVNGELQPALEQQRAYMQNLEKDAIKSLPYLQTHVERGAPEWERALGMAKRSTQQMISFLEEDIKVLSKLIAAWKQEPLPEAGKPAKNWKKLKDR